MFSLIVGVIFDDALLNNETAIVLPIGRADAKQYSHADELNPIMPTNEYPSITGTSIDKLIPLFPLTATDVDNVLTCDNGNIETQSNDFLIHYLVQLYS